MGLVLLLIIGVGVGLYIHLYNRIQVLERDLRELRFGSGGRPVPLPGYAQTQPMPNPITSAPLSSATIPPGERLAVAAAEMHRATERRDLEFRFGGKALTIIGAIAVILGVAFFLRYAFDQNLISETVRMVLGIVAGVGLGTLGVWLRAKHSWYGNVLIGGGLGLLYLSLYAGFAFYNVIGFATAFAAMIVVSVIGVGISLRYNTPALTVIAQIGAFLTPLLLNNGENHIHAVFPYLIVVVICLTALSWRRPWQFIQLGNLAGVVIVAASWFIHFYNNSQYTPAIVYITLLFLLFIATSFIRMWRSDKPSDVTNVIGAFLLPLPYFLAGYFMTRAIYPDWRGFFVMALAIVYCLLAAAARASRKPAAMSYQQIMLALSFVFLIIFAPVQLGQSWVGVAWSVEALVLFLLALQFDSRALRVVSMALFQLAMLRLFVWDGLLTGTPVAWLNERTLPFALATIFFVVGFLIARASERLRTERQEWLAYILSINIFLIISYWFSLEIIDFHPTWWLAVLWSVLAAAGVALGIHDSNTPLRAVSYTMFGITGLRLLFSDGRSITNDFTLLANHRVFVFLIAFAAIIYAVHTVRASQVSQGEKSLLSSISFTSAQFLILYLIGRETYDYYGAKEAAQFIGARSPMVQQEYDGGLRPVADHYDNVKRAVLSITWTLYALALLMYGIMRRSAPARTAAMAVFGFVILKVFLYDTALLDNFYRFISFITLGVLLLLTGYLYHRYRERIHSFIKAQ